MTNKPIFHSYLSEIENYKPGKAKVANKSKVIKLSSNENALGASPKAIESYINHSKDVFRYANGSCENLREAIGIKNNIDPERIVCGAGSDEIIALLTAAFAQIGDEVIYSEHGFLMYPISAKRVGAKAIKVKENNLKADIDAILAAITAKTKIIFIANPNNPTGSYLNQKEIQKLIDNTPKNILIVLDHAYEEFVIKNSAQNKISSKTKTSEKYFENDYPDAIKLVNENSNIVVTRTFSKIYGLASLRIGWCYSSSEIAEILNKIRGPFNVGGPAQTAAIAALNDEEFFNNSINHNSKWLEIFFNELAGNNKINAHPSIANFILLDFGEVETCQKANELMLSEGIILREMTSYNLPNCLRMTIGTEEENLQVLKILKSL